MSGSSSPIESASPMQYRENSYTVPLVKNNKLAGLLLRYDPRVTSARRDPRADHRSFSQGCRRASTIAGFPSAGFSFFPTRDPQLRSLRRTNGQTGRRLCDQRRTGFAGDERRVCRSATSSRRSTTTRSIENGNYVDPLYGKIEFTNLITAHAFAGDTVPFQIQRGGQTDAAATSRSNIGHPSDYVIPPYNLDRSARLLRSRRSHFSGVLTSISQRMGRKLAEGCAAAFRLYGSLPDRSCSRKGIGGSSS